MVMKTAPRYLTQAAFARLHGVAKSHVTKLKQAGRLVMTPAGMVDVAASDVLIAQTGGLRPDVAERLAEQRAPAAAAPPPEAWEARPRAESPAAPADAPDTDPTAPDGDPTAPDGDPAAPDGDTAPPRKGSAASELRRRREETKRQAKLIELGLLRGALLERADVDRHAADLGVTLRATLDAVVERLAPRLSSAPSAAHIAALTARELARERRRINRALVRSARELAKPGDTAHA